MSRTSLRRIRETAVVVSLLALGSTPAAAADPPSQGMTPIVVRVDGGFSWAEAGIGVVAGAGAALAVVGGAALMRPSNSGGRQPRKEQAHDHEDH